MLSVLLYTSWLLGVFLYFQKAMPMSFKKSRGPGEELLEWVKKFNWARRDIDQHQIPEYKFFTDLINLLLEMSRRYGGQYKEALISVRESLGADIQFEKKLKEFIWASYFQKSCIFILSWGFIMLATSMTDIQLDFSVYIGIFSWQVMGLLLFPFICRKLKNYYFNGIGKVWLSLYVLRSLSSAGLARSEIFKLAKINELQSVKHKNLESLVGKLQDTCELSLKQGGSYLKEVEELSQECRFIEKWHLELFEKRLGAFKLAILGGFFLPSYLGFMYFLLSSFLHRI
jgi:hypothetical protein